MGSLLLPEGHPAAGGSLEVGWYIAASHSDALAVGLPQSGGNGWLP